MHVNFFVCTFATSSLKYIINLGWGDNTHHPPKQQNKMKKTIKELKKGEFFRTTENGPVWVRGYYCADIKKFECYKFDDCNHENFYKGSKAVFVGFEF